MCRDAVAYVVYIYRCTDADHGKLVEILRLGATESIDVASYFHPVHVKEHGVIGSIEGTQNVRPDEVFVSGLDRRASLDLADNGRRTPEHVRPLIGIDTELIADHVSVSIQAQGALNNDHSAVRIGVKGQIQLWTNPGFHRPALIAEALCVRIVFHGHIGVGLADVHQRHVEEGRTIQVQDQVLHPLVLEAIQRIAKEAQFGVVVLDDVGDAVIISIRQLTVGVLLNFVGVSHVIIISIDIEVVSNPWVGPSEVLETVGTAILVRVTVSSVDAGGIERVQRDCAGVG